MSENKGSNSLATGVAGAIIGAAAAAAAMFLSDGKNRKKAEKVLSELEKKGDSVLKEITKKALQLKDAVEPKKVPAKVGKVKKKK